MADAALAPEAPLRGGGELALLALLALRPWLRSRPGALFLACVTLYPLLLILAAAAVAFTVRRRCGGDRQEEQGNPEPGWPGGMQLIAVSS